MEIELKYLAEKIKLVIDDVHLNPNKRYRSVCFMTNDIQLSEGLKSVLYIELSSYERWFCPGQGDSPKYGISRVDFEKQILNDTSRGLLIYRPEDWISSWPKIEQAAFLSFISMLHGHKYIVLVTTLSTQSDIKRYMNEFMIEGTGISYWLSNKEQNREVL